MLADNDRETQQVGVITQSGTTPGSSQEPAGANGQASQPLDEPIQERNVQRAFDGEQPENAAQTIDRDLSHEQGDGSEKIESGHEDDPTDPITWQWRRLFELYIFADEYDTRLYRSAAIDIIQVKSLQTISRTYLWSSPQGYAYAFNNLPRNSPLHRLLIELAAWWLAPNENPDRWSLTPSDVFALLRFKQKKLEAFNTCNMCFGVILSPSEDCPCDKRDLGGDCRDKHCESAAHARVTTRVQSWAFAECDFHEHESKEERELCSKWWALIRVERGVDYFDAVHK